MVIVANSLHEGEITNMCEVLDKLEAKARAQVRENVAMDC